MAALFSTPKIPGPSAAQLDAQERQARLAATEEARLQKMEREEAASAAARRGRMAGRLSLLADDVGVTQDERAPKQTLGG